MASREYPSTALGNTPLAGTLRAANCRTYKKFADEQRKILSAKYPFLQKSQINRKTADLWASMAAPRRTMTHRNKRSQGSTSTPRSHTPRTMNPSREPSAPLRPPCPRPHERSCPSAPAQDTSAAPRTPYNDAINGSRAAAPRKNLPLDLVFDGGFEPHEGTALKRPVSYLPPRRDMGDCSPGDSGDSDSDTEGRLMQINREIQAHAAESEDQEEVLEATTLEDLGDVTGGQSAHTPVKQTTSTAARTDTQNSTDIEEGKHDRSLPVKTACGKGKLKKQNHVEIKINHNKGSKREVAAPSRTTRTRAKRTSQQDSRVNRKKKSPTVSNSKLSPKNLSSHGGKSSRLQSRGSQQQDAHLGMFSPQPESGGGESNTDESDTKPGCGGYNKVASMVINKDDSCSASKSVHRKKMKSRSEVSSPPDIYPSVRVMFASDDALTSAPSRMSPGPQQQQQSPALFVPFPDMIRAPHTPSPPRHRTVFSAVDRAVTAMRRLVATTADPPPSPQSQSDSVITSSQLSSISTLSSLVSEGTQNVLSSPHPEDPFQSLRVYSPRHKESQPDATARRTRSMSLSDVRSPESARRRLADKLLQALNEASQATSLAESPSEQDDSACSSVSQRSSESSVRRRMGKPPPSTEPSGGKKRKNVDVTSGGISKKLESVSDAPDEDDTISDCNVQAKRGKTSKQNTVSKTKKNLKPMQAEITRYLTKKPLPLLPKPDMSLCDLFDEPPRKKPSRSRRRLLTGRTHADALGAASSMLDEAAFIET